MNELENLVIQIRRDILRMVNNVKSGHPGGSLGCTEFFVVLFFKIMKRKEKFEMNGKNEDLFFLSNGHISPVYYSTLARAGYFPVEELNTFRKINSRLQGHPTTHEGLPGIRIASGSLGQGMSVAIGAALTKKLNNDRALFTLFMEMVNFKKVRIGKQLCLHQQIKLIILFVQSTTIKNKLMEI